MKKNEVIKHSSTIQINNKITLFQRKAWNIMLAHAFNDLENHDIKTFKIPVKTLYSYLGYKNTNISGKKVKAILKDLITTGIEWNILGKDKDEWAAVTLLSGCEVVGGICEYDYSIILRRKLANPSIYARINLSIQNKFGSKYALALYELFLDYKGVGKTPVIDIPDFRRLVGLEEKEYNTFKLLNHHIIKKAVREINKLSNLWIEVEYKKSGRTVTAVKFYIKEKKELPQPSDLPIPAETRKNRKKAGTRISVASCDKTEIGSDLEAELISMKFSKKQARAVVKNYHRDQIRRNIDMTLKKAEKGEVRNIPGFLTDAIKEDYAKDYNPVDEKHQELILEAKKCWQKTNGSCASTWKDYKDESHACHWCKKFAANRNSIAEADQDQNAGDQQHSDNPESLFAIVPVKISNPLRKLITQYYKSEGPDYTRRNIEHTNQNIKDKRKYRAFLEKTLIENQAAGVENPGDKTGPDPGTEFDTLFASASEQDKERFQAAISGSFLIMQFKKKGFSSKIVQMEFVKFMAGSGSMEQGGDTEKEKIPPAPGDVKDDFNRV